MILYSRLVTDGNGIVEGQAERFVSLSVALGTIKQILLDIVADGEQGTAGGVRSGMDTIGTSNTPRQGSYKMLINRCNS